MLVNTENQSQNIDNIQHTIATLSTVELKQCEHKGMCLILNNEHGRVVVSLFGAHVLSYINKADNKERLWLSKDAIFDNKTPIRGGIPICWPWFSAHPIHNDFPSHGYARTQMFKLVDAQEKRNEDNVTTTQITLCPTNPCQYGYDDMTMHVVISLNTKLHIDIVSTNQGLSPIALTQALHSYFLVDDISKVIIEGVDTPYTDKPSNTANNASPSPYIFDQEVDRIHAYEHAQYKNKQVIQIVSKSVSSDSTVCFKTEHNIIQSGHDSTVVWNPWIEKSDAMHDVHANGFVTMLCIEAANTQNAKPALVLEHNKTHTLSQAIA